MRRKKGNSWVGEQEGWWEVKGMSMTERKKKEESKKRKR